jgi:hypothetical protein
VQSATPGSKQQDGLARLIYFRLDDSKIIESEEVKQESSWISTKEVKSLA